ncbi:MAG: flavodoxin domain-containing protein [Chloroflexota bacterium]|nr:flavodoxin domain-containing protein [Lentimicrobium sp.]
MKSVIIYSTKHGTTKKVAEMISQMAKEKPELINLKKVKDINLDDYDSIIIGGSIHAGNVQTRIKRFCHDHMLELSTKPLGLFLSCMEEDKAQEQFDNAYPESLRKAAVSTKLTGGEILLDKMNFLERYIVKKVGKMTETVSNIKEDKVKELVNEMGLT